MQIYNVSNMLSINGDPLFSLVFMSFDIIHQLFVGCTKSQKSSYKKETTELKIISTGFNHYVYQYNECQSIFWTLSIQRTLALCNNLTLCMPFTISRYQMYSFDISDYSTVHILYPRFLIDWSTALFCTVCYVQVTYSVVACVGLIREYF